MKITRQLIQDGKSKRGGWSKKQVEELGIWWPLKPGWIDRAIGREVLPAQVSRFLALRDAHLEPTADMWPEDVNHLRAIMTEQPREMERSGPMITGVHYKPDGCTCGLPPWELCRPDCEYRIAA